MNKEAVEQGLVSVHAQTTCETFYLRTFCVNLRKLLVCYKLFS